MIVVQEYNDRSGRSPYADWFNRLNSQAAAKAAVVPARLAQGNFSNVKDVGSGAFECRIDFGPGYRVYFGRDGERLVILLGGGTKKRQERELRQPLTDGRIIGGESRRRSNGPDARFQRDHSRPR